MAGAKTYLRLFSYFSTQETISVVFFHGIGKVPPSERTTLLISALRQLGAEPRLEAVVKAVANEHAAAAVSVAQASALANIPLRVREEAKQYIRDSDAMAPPRGSRRREP